MNSCKFFGHLIYAIMAITCIEVGIRGMGYNVLEILHLTMVPHINTFCQLIRYIAGISGIMACVQIVLRCAGHGKSICCLMQCDKN